jgi:TMEM175 potassium channel family protein
LGVGRFPNPISSFSFQFFSFPKVVKLRSVESNRLEAFSDGVFAIIITIMVLELKVPHDPDIKALQPLLPVFFTYALSFVYVGIYWNNHHHLLKTCHRISGGIMWANLHLLFWLSLFPFVTGWMGENHFQSIPSALYGGVLLMAAVAYVILQTLMIRLDGRGSKLARAIGSDLKGKLSPVLYATGIGVSFVQPWIAGCIYIGVALMWLIPDRRLQKALAASVI